MKKLKDEIINLSDYNYPRPNNNSDKIILAIVNTNDIHGAAFSKKIKLNNNQTLYKGGVEYLASYIDALKTEFKDNFLWLDSGDQFSGTFESRMTDGKVISDFFNIMNLNAATIGNHEFDWGRKTMSQMLKRAKFPYISANIRRRFNKSKKIENLIPTKIFKIPGNNLKIGVIGITTINTPHTTAGDVSDLYFEDYRDVVIKKSKELKSGGAHLVIVLAHVGIHCRSKNYNSYDYFKLRIINEKNDFSECFNPNNENLLSLVQSLPDNTIDGIFGGHLHKSVHSFVKGIPIVHNPFHGLAINIVYFTFDRKTLKYEKNSTLIEGPVPVCSKIFTKSKSCDISKSNNQRLSNFYFHGKLIKRLNVVKNLLQPFLKKIQKIRQEHIFSINKKIMKVKDNNNILSDFSCDLIRNITNSDFCILNTGMFRGVWYPPYVSQYQYYEMFSLTNDIVTFEVKGKILKKIMTTLTKGNRAFYATGGLSAFVRLFPRKDLVKLTTWNGEKIINEKVYTVGTVDFLLRGGDDFKYVLKYFTPKIKKNFGEFRRISFNLLRKNKFKCLRKETLTKRKLPSLVFVKS